jgi:protein TonB
VRFGSDNIDEIVFQYRNKSYGAYLLRKKYNKFLIAAIIISSVFFFLAAFIPSLMFHKPETTIIENKLYTEFMPVPQEKKKNPETDLPPELQKIRKAVKFVAPQIVVTQEEEVAFFINEEIKGDTAGEGTSSEGSNKGVLDGGEPASDAVYTYVEESPSFPGGEKARINFLKNNIKYPSTALQNKIQGKVYISFIVEKDGSLSNISVLQGIGAGCDEEALRVTRLMPRWKPGKTQGHEVRVVITMPVNFVLQMSSPAQ